MQYLSTLSKYFILVILSCSLLIVFTTINNNQTTIISSENELTATNAFTDVIVSDVSTMSKHKRSIWDSMRSEFQLDHRVRSEQVQAEIKKLLADKNSMQQIFEAAGPYIYFIYQQTKAHGLPAELALIPFIESEFNPNDHSSKGATGLWQLMPETAHDLGVKIKSGYDGRRNLISSTEAALNYFKDLNNNFNGNWYLAIAAYNCGPGRIISAKRHAGSSDFFAMNRLPKETRYYVPKLLAVAAIVENPGKYGVQLPPINNEPYFKEVKVDKTINLEKVAKTSGVSVKTIQKLNADYKRQAIVTPKTGARNSVLLPITIASHQIQDATVVAKQKKKHIV